MPGDACACSPADWPFAAVLCATHYEFPVDRLIRQYKESPRPELARPLARLMAQRIRRHPGPRPALLAPVPAADSRLRQRGFDQSRELARELGLLLKIPVRDDLFRRRDGLAAQKSLTAARREANMRDAFQPANLRNLPDHVALVDDVLTRGPPPGGWGRCCIGRAWPAWKSGRLRGRCSTRRNYLRKPRDPPKLRILWLE